MTRQSRTSIVVTSLAAVMVAAVIVGSTIRGEAAQTASVRPTPQAMQLIQCEQDRKQAADAGWDLTTVYAGCESGIKRPVRTRNVNAAYTPEAMRARIQGSVEVLAAVDADGVVRDARVVKSLDSTFGLDEQALKAVRAMTFEPGTFNGKPTRTLASFTLQFTLR